MLVEDYNDNFAINAENNAESLFENPDDARMMHIVNPETKQIVKYTLEDQVADSGVNQKIAILIYLNLHTKNIVFYSGYMFYAPLKENYGKYIIPNCKN